MGLSKVLFTFITTKDAAAFLVMKSKLAQHVGTKSWHGAAMASRAIEDMEDPDMNKPDRSIEKKEGKDRDSDDLEFKMECEEYTKVMK